jgi:dCTP diphosphatase
MQKLKELTQKVVEFREARDWEQFHNAKDLALSLVLEATEVLEHFQWKNPEEVMVYSKTNKDEIGEELADVLYWVILMSHDLELDIEEALNSKLKKNAEKYPVNKAKGTAKKYDQL